MKQDPGPIPMFNLGDPCGLLLGSKAGALDENTQFPLLFPLEEGWGEQQVVPALGCDVGVQPGFGLFPAPKEGALRRGDAGGLPGSAPG